MKYKTTSLFSFVLLLLGGCGHISTHIERYKTLNTIASEQNLSIKTLHTASFDLTSIVSTQCESKSMRVYIEGDGLAWVTRSRLSNDPTPINPIALKLMLIDTSGCKAYLARPCQYGQIERCNNRYWSSHRFSPEVIESYNEVLDQFKKNYSIESFDFVGYSGGGAVALLIGATRDDIDKITTIAGNIDTEFWTQYHNIDPLRNSLNPADFTVNLENITQHHLIGRNDKVIPKEVYFSYLSKFKNKKNISYSIYEASHSCCWEEIYKVFGKKNMWE